MIAGPDFVVLTGFLGSGKTTLLRDYLGRPEAAETAIIVNEAGEIGLDGVILRESGGDVPMTMLSNGCICCQLGSDLANTVEALIAAERPDPAIPLKRIVLETSGLSKPGPVLRQLASLAEYRMRVAVVATYDALRGADTTGFEEAAAQWAGAHRIVLTKADAVSPERLATAAAAMAALNPLAEAVVAADRDAVVAACFAPLAASTPFGAPPRATVDAPAHPRIAVHLARPAGVVPYEELAAWLDNLAGALGERLLRLKGLVRVAESERPVLVQSVGTLFAPPRPFAADAAFGGSFVVVIVRDGSDVELAAIPPAGFVSVSRLDRPMSLARTRRPAPITAERIQG